MKEPIKVTYAPGCFDDFEGSQAELDGLMEEIKRLAESGELEEHATLVEFDDLDEELNFDKNTHRTIQ